jgi:hypothetical protein
MCYKVYRGNSIRSVDLILAVWNLCDPSDESVQLLPLESRRIQTVDLVNGLHSIVELCWKSMQFPYLIQMTLKYYCATCSESEVSSRLHHYKAVAYLFFFPLSIVLPAHSGPRPLIQFHHHFSQTVGLLRRVISPSQGLYLNTKVR